MGAYTSLDELVKYSTSGSAESIWYTKDSRVEGAAANSTNNVGRLISLWQYEGQPCHGAVPPTTAANPTNETTGSLRQRNPGAGSQKWLQHAFIATNNIAQVHLYDRLMHISGLNGTVTTAQLVSGSVTRYTGSACVGNEVLIEIYSTIGTSATTLTMNYVNQDGVDKTSDVITIGGTGAREPQRMLVVPLAQGDTGVQRVDSIMLAGSTGTAGNFGVVIARILTTNALNVIGLGSIRTYMDGVIPEIKSGACLSLMTFAQSSLTPTPLIGSFFFVDR